MSGGTEWSRADILVLEDNPQLNSKEMCELLPMRTYNGIVQKRHKLGIASTQKAKWEDWEVDLMRCHKYMSSLQMSETVLPHRPYEGIKSYRNKLKIPHIVRCNKCGEEMIKNNGFDICSKCKKTHKEYNSTVSHKYSQYMSGAKKRGYEFSITLEEFTAHYYLDCCYCGDKVDGIGLDRVDNTKGYTSDNIVACCENCNRLKMDRDLPDWINHMKKILINQGEI